MARYDRIAPLESPARDNAFPGWWVLRDVESFDRDAEQSRRARLRFLALRPVMRLVGTTPVSSESYLKQIEGVREELGYLPSRDAERARLARFLHRVENADKNDAAAATLEMADACLGAGLLYGAEEYALTALTLDATCGANSVLAGVARARGDHAAAKEFAQRALTIAEREGRRADSVRANAEMALTLAASGDVAGARKQLQATDALTSARLAALELSVNNPDAALEKGVPALRGLDDLRERAALLEVVGRAFLQLGLPKFAERCFATVGQRGVDAGIRARSRASQAATSAISGNREQFRERRTSLMNDASEWSGDARVSAFVQLELGRACVVAHDPDDAREHLRAALATARKHHLGDILARAEEVLSALEMNAAEQLVNSSFRGTGAENARKMAEQFEALPELPVVV